jgi:hypothetical protein
MKRVDKKMGMLSKDTITLIFLSFYDMIKKEQNRHFLHYLCNPLVINID